MTETQPDAPETRSADDNRAIRVQYRVYFGIGGFLFLTGVAYWFLSYEDAGTVMLLLAGVLGFIVGVWIWVQSHNPAKTDAVEHAEGEWLPHASIWPFWIGLGAAFAAGGLAMSPWLVAPGVFVLLIGVVGFARQSRYRS
jgi:hypothetical protein